MCKDLCDFIQASAYHLKVFKEYKLHTPTLLLNFNENLAIGWDLEQPHPAQFDCWMAIYKARYRILGYCHLINGQILVILNLLSKLIYKQLITKLL